MSGDGAFHARMDVRDGLVADINSSGPVTKNWLSRGLDEQGMASLVRDYAVAPELLGLMAELSGDPMDTDVQQFLAQTIEAIEPGLPMNAIADIVRRWFVWSWDDATWGLDAGLRGTDAHAPALAIIEAVRASIASPGATVDWSPLRRALARVDGLTLDGIDIVEVVLGMSWDVAAVSGAAVDVAVAFRNLIKRRTNRLNGWTDEKEKELIDYSMAVHDEAMAITGEPTEENKDEFLVAYKQLTQDIRARGEKAALIAENVRSRHLANEQSWDWRDAARQALIDAARTPVATSAA